MEQENNYIPYEERSLKELRSDINMKAEKLFVQTSKADKVIWAILAIAFVAFEVLNLRYKFVVQNWWMLGAFLCGVALVVYIFRSIKKRLFSTMELARDATQHYKATMMLIRVSRGIEAICSIMVILLTAVVISGEVLIKDWFSIAVGVLVAVIAFFTNPRPRAGNKRYEDLYDDVEELSMYAEE